MSGSPFDVHLTREADRDLRKLQQWSDEIEELLFGLGDDPYQGEVLAGSLRGVRSLHFSLKGSGAYRAAYVVLDEDEVVLIFMIASRENFYSEATRRFQTLRLE